MRVRIGDDAETMWIAGHPDFDPAAWTPAQDQNDTGLHEMIPQTGAGWVARRFTDGGNRGVVIRFSVTRLFANVRAMAAWRFSLFSATPPHPLSGDVYLRHDDDLGAREDKISDAVVRVLGGTVIGALSYRVNYEISGGLVGYFAANEFCLLLTDTGEPLVQDDGDYLQLDQCTEIDPPFEPPYGYYWTP